MKDKLFDGLKGISRKWNEIDVKMLSPLQLAYIGDAVYELFVRNYLIEQHPMSVNDLHKEAVQFVKAEAQSNFVHFLEDTLDEDEWRVVKRGRNAKSGSVPKNANLTDYKYATGFEALIGFLFLLGRYERILKLFQMILDKHKKDQL